MQVVLNEQILESGITVDDITHMLKACEKVILVEVYEPTLQEVMELVDSAAKAELEKKRVVVKWNQLISEFKSLTK